MKNKDFFSSSTRAKNQLSIIKKKERKKESKRTMASLGRFHPTPTNFIYSSKNAPSTSNPANFTIDCDRLGELGIYNFPTPFAIKRVSFVLRREVTETIVAAVGCNLALSMHDTKPNNLTEQSGHFSPFIIAEGSIGFQDVIFSSPVSRLSSGGRFGYVQFWLVDLTTRRFLTDYIDEESVTYVHIETSRESFQQPKQSALFSTANCILSSSSRQAHLSLDDNTPSQFTSLLANGSNTFLDQELDWSMALKWCCIPNRFNTISSDGTCFITVQSILSPPDADDPIRVSKLSQEDLFDFFERYDIDGGEVTVFIKPGCYLTAEELAEAISESFAEHGLPLECVPVTKVVEFRRQGASTTPFAVVKNTSHSFVAQLLMALHSELFIGLNPADYDDCEEAAADVQRVISDHNETDNLGIKVIKMKTPLLAILDTRPPVADGTKYFINVSPTLARICGFEADPDQIMAVSSMPILSKVAVDLKAIYPQQFLLCSNVLQPSYILGGNDTSVKQPFLYHFTVPHPHKHTLIKAGNGVGSKVRIAHLGFDSLRFTMCSLDGRQLEIDSQSRTVNTTWLNIHMSSAARRPKRH